MVIMLEYDTRGGYMLYAHSARGVRPGRVLFRPMTCTGLDRTKLR